MRRLLHLPRETPPLWGGWVRFTGGEVYGEVCGEVLDEHLTIRNPHGQRVLGHFGEVSGYHRSSGKFG